jgi:hypothetical protein
LEKLKIKLDDLKQGALRSGTVGRRSSSGRPNVVQ